MAWTKLFPPKKYTKYISWDILDNDRLRFRYQQGHGEFRLCLHDSPPYNRYGRQFGAVCVGWRSIYLITNIFTELITNNAAAALSFPIALSVATQLGVDPTPFFVVICMAASASFSTPIGYQTNLIVQGVGGYKFTDFVKVGLPLNLITFLISVFVIPMIWKF